MSDREALRRLAMRAQELDYCGADYENATAPPIVLALLDEIDRLNAVVAVMGGSTREDRSL